MVGNVSSHSVERAGYFYEAGAIDDGRRRRFQKAGGEEGT